MSLSMKEQQNPVFYCYSVLLQPTVCSSSFVHLMNSLQQATNEVQRFKTQNIVSNFATLQNKI